MPNRLTRIYTRKGDEGYTSLGDRMLSKDELLVEAVGTIDELNACIGLLISSCPKQQAIVHRLTEIQHRLFDMGAELHLPAHPLIKDEYITELEKQLDEWNDPLPPLKEFVLPGGNQAAATSHLARTVCRRAERALVRLHRQISLANPAMLRFLNRLSDLLFVISRLLARETNPAEPLWEHAKHE